MSAIILIIHWALFRKYRHVWLIEIKFVALLIIIWQFANYF